MSNFLRQLFILALFKCALEAKDFGVWGSTSPVKEEDLIHFIQKRIQYISEEERETLMQTLQNSFISQFKKPMEVKGIKKAKVYSVTYFDPSICLDRDILNHQGQIIVKKGSQYNPLSNFSLSQDLLFFDATDKEQLAWAESQTSSAKWILVKGQPMQLEEELNHPVYFDQGGILTKKLKIQQVPARVSQEDLRLKIEFILVGDLRCAHCS